MENNEEKKSVRRIAFYTFYEKNGIVRDYIVYYLRALKEVAETIVVVVNGTLSDTGRERLNELGAEILVRENRGFDFSAWKKGIETIGKERLAQFDEIILCNCSCYGPVYPFSKVFEKMAQQECDFWGLFRHPKGKIYPSHLQSYFLVLRNSLFRDDAFAEYWKRLVPAKSWWDAVCQETHFTPFFEERGFRSASFVPSGKYNSFIADMSAFAPVNLLQNDAFPLVKRKVFTYDYSVFFECGLGRQAIETLDYLKKNTEFDVNQIFQDLLAACPQSKLRQALHDTFILPDNYCADGNAAEGNEKIALIAHSFYEDLIDENLNFIKNVPAGTDIFIVVVSDATKTAWQKKLAEFPLRERRVEIRMQENRGRNEAAYWLTCRDIIETHDIICLAHDKKSPSVKPGIAAVSFSKHCWENVLKTSEYVQNIIRVFRENPRIGLLTPPTPAFSTLRNLPKSEWGINFGQGKALYKKLNLHVPFDLEPNAPFGSLFWVRGNAMKPFYRYSWTWEDFPKEPLKGDGTILHALERTYPMIAQESGYYTGWILPMSNAGVYYDNVFFNLGQQLTLTAAINDAKNVPSEVLSKIHFRMLKNLAKLYLRKKNLQVFRNMSPRTEKALPRKTKHVRRRFFQNIAAAGASALLFCGYRWRFDKTRYLAMNEDVRAAGADPWKHFVRHGYREKRAIKEINYSSYGLGYGLLRKLAAFVFRKQIARSASVKILVHLHLFYSNAWCEIVEYLKNLEAYPFDLIVSVPEENADESIKAEILRFKPDTRILEYPNQGFDVGPFSDILQRVPAEKYDIVFHLHSKNIASRLRVCYGQAFLGKDWFRQLFSGCLGVFNVHKAIRLLTENNRVGLVGAKNLIVSDSPARESTVAEFGHRMGINVPANYKFLMGTCFACRMQALNTFRGLNLSINTFPKSTRAIFTLAHALERLLPISIEQSGFSLVGLPVFARKHQRAMKKALIALEKRLSGATTALSSFGFSDISPLQLDMHSGLACLFFSARHDDGTNCFIKWGGNKEIAENEIAMMSRMSAASNHFLPVVASRCDSKCCFIASPMLRGFDLERLCQMGLSQEEVRSIELQLTEIENTLNAESVIHRDIRPANLFYAEDGKLYLIDLQFMVQKDEYGNLDELSFLKRNPQLAEKLGDVFKKGPGEWDDSYSIAKVREYLNEPLS